MKYLGDYAEDYATLNFKFSTHKADGTPIALAGSPAVSVYKANGTTQSTAGITLSVDFDSITGLNNVLIDLSADAFYAVANDYQVVITTGTVNSVSVVGTVLAHFSIENRFNEVDVTKISGDSTAADNLELACDNYSVTRGLTGTALPAAAADAAGGLPISDAGGLDIDTLLATLTNGTYGLSALETLVDELESRLTAARAGYLDKLNITGNVAATGEAAAALTSYDPPTKSELDTWGTTLANYIDTEISSILGVTAKLDTAMEADGDVYRFTANALEQAPSSSGGDATAANQTTIINHLTGIKGATFDTSTDSLEAIRNRGDSAWTTGGGASGSNAITLTITDTDDVNIVDAAVEVWDSAGTSFIERKASNSSGQAVFNLDDGTYTVKVHKAGYSIANQTLIVSGVASVTYEMTAYTISAPADPALCRVYGYFYNPKGGFYTSLAPISIVDEYETGNNFYAGRSTGVYSVSTGLVYWDVPQGATATLEISEISYSQAVTVPAAATAALDTLII